MSNATDMITSAMRLIGALDPGESASSSELNDGLARLNDLLDSWAANRAMVYSITRQNFNLASGTQSYTFGPSATFNIAARPVKIESAEVSMASPSGGPRITKPCAVLTPAQWSAIEQKSRASSFPTELYCDYAFPTATIYFNPVPNGSGRQVHLMCWTALAAYPNLTDDVTLPPAYSRALQYNLALDLAPEYGRAASQELVKSAGESLAFLSAVNLPPAPPAPPAPAAA